MRFIPTDPLDQHRTEIEVQNWQEEMARRKRQDQLFQDISDSMKKLEELRRLADSAEARAVAAQATARKASITSWVSIAIALAAFAWNVVAHFI